MPSSIAGTEVAPAAGEETRNPRNAPAGYPSGLDRRLAANSLSNVARYAVSVAVGFFLTPFVVRTLGDVGYGFWVVLLSFVGYAGILELGVLPAVVKMIGQYDKEGTSEQLDELLAAAFVFFATVGLIAAVTLAVTLPILVPLLAKDAPSILASPLLYWIIAFDVFLVFLNIFLTGLLYGWQLYPQKNAVDTAIWILNAALLVLFLKQGGLIALAVVKVGTDLLSLLVTGWIVRRMRPEFRLRLGTVTGSSIKRLLGFGGRLFASATTTRVATHAHPLVIGSRISTAAIAFFAIPVRLVDYSREISWALAAGFMPTFSQLEARSLPGVLRSVYIRYSRYILAVTLPLHVLLLTYGAEFIGLWIGPEYGAKARIPLRLIAAAALIDSFQPLAWRLFIGVGRLGKPVVISATCSLASIGLSILLAPVLGLAGPALAILTTAVIGQVLYTRIVSQYLDVRIPLLVVSVAGRAMIAGAILLSAGIGIEQLVGAESSRRIAFGMLLIVAIYLPLMMGIILDGSERRRLGTLASRALHRVRGLGSGA